MENLTEELLKEARVGRIRKFVAGIPDIYMADSIRDLVESNPQIGKRHLTCLAGLTVLDTPQYERQGRVGNVVNLGLADSEGSLEAFVKERMCFDLGTFNIAKNLHAGEEISILGVHGSGKNLLGFHTRLLFGWLPLDFKVAYAENGQFNIVHILRNLEEGQELGASRFAYAFAHA